MPQPHIFIATHHKAGTVWMNSTFRRIAKANRFRFVHLNSGEPAWTTRPDKGEYLRAMLDEVEQESDRPGVFVDYHSTTPDLSGIKRARGLHLVRDPRDMLISAIRYHKTSDEQWLDVPHREWGGESFRQRLGALDEDDRIRFELDTYMGEEINRMAGFCDRPDHGQVFRCVRYEDLILDADMTQFHDHLVHLGLGGLELIQGLRAYWQSSVFGEMNAAQESGKHHHIRDARPCQWRSVLSPAQLELIQSRIGNEIESLGYPLI